MGDSLCSAVESQDVTLVQKLLDDQNDPDSLDSEKRLPLTIAAGQNSMEIIKLLLMSGCSVNIPDGRGKCPLHEAALTDKASSVDVVLLLLENGADPDTRDSYHETPLMTACYWSNIDVIKLLAERTKDINYQTLTTHKAAIHYAAMSRQAGDAVGLLLQFGADPSLWHDDYETPLIIATRSNGIQAVKSLLKTNCSVNYRGFMDYTALHWAVYCNHTDIVQLLLEQDASVNLHNCLDRLPMHVAASCGAVNSAKLLLQAGSMTETVDSNGMTPLLASVQAGYGDIAKLLLYANADPDRTLHYEGRTPLMVALLNTHTDIAKDLIFAGCNLRQYWENHKRFTPNRGPEFFRNMVRNQGKLADLLDNHICLVRSLQHLCRLTIRKRLTHSFQVHSDIQKLNLPTSLKEYLAMKEILGNTKFCTDM